MNIDFASLLDSAFIGGMITLILTSIFSLVNLWITIWRDNKHLRIQQEVEDRRRREEERKQNIQLVTEIYHNCMSRLAFTVAVYTQNLNISPEEQAQLYKDTLHWLSRLALHRNDLYKDGSYSFQDRVNDFANLPLQLAESILDQVKQMAAFDPLLSPDAKPSQKDPSHKQVQVDVDDNFRKQSAIEGREIPQHYIFHCDISLLTQTQREKLWDAEKRRIPERIYLNLPTYDEKKNQIVIKQSESWKASLDPTSSSPNEIFDAWEKAYNKAFEIAEQAKNFP